MILFFGEAMRNRAIIFCLSLTIFLNSGVVPLAFATEKEGGYQSEAYVLMEASTGTIIDQKNPDMQLRPASITKIMTLLLIFEALSNGRCNLTDIVTVSEHAASLGGSQVYLEPYEKQSVKDMIKCISIASANDASVAMAEHIAGSEEQFVKMMNEKAAGLGMKNTYFVNCYGLDTDSHLTSAMDVALMSRELIVRYPDIFQYSTTWMDTIQHITAKGTSEFGLTNTNRLIKTYPGITGLKTGSTGLAKYCLSATARRNNMDMIAVIMAAPDTKTRFAEAASLLNYGFANCRLFTHSGEGIELTPVTVHHGVTESITLKFDGCFSYVCVGDVDPEKISFEVQIPEELEAPVQIGDRLGEVRFRYLEKDIGSLDIIASETCERAEFKDCLRKSFRLFLHQ